MEPLLAPMTPAPDRTTSHFTDADVASVSPLRVRLAGDAAEIDADSLISAGSLAVGDRVRVELAGRRVVVHGRAGGGAGGTLAVGMVIDWPAGSPTPAYALDCDGQAVSRSTYASLFGTIGTAYGAGDGSTTFNVPDLRYGDEPVSVRLTKTGSATTSPTPGTPTDISWSATSVATSIWSASDPTRIKPNRKGRWRVRVKVRASAGSTAYVQVRLNGASNSPSEGLATDSVAGPYPVAEDVFDIAHPDTDYITTSVMALSASVNLTTPNLQCLIDYLGPSSEYTDDAPTRKIVISTDQGRGVTIIQGQGAFLGQVIGWPGHAGAPIPANCLELNGQTVSALVYAGLAALFPGWVSGANLVLPDLRGRTLVGYQAGDSLFGALGGTPGSKTHTLAFSELPGQLVREGTATGGNLGTAGLFNRISNNGSSDQPHNNVQPSYVGRWLIVAADSAGEYSSTVQSALTGRVGALEDRTLRGSVPSSVVVGSGTASVAADGTVTFSGASSVSLNGVFDGTGGDLYDVHLRLVASTTASVSTRMRASGVDTAANYSYVAWAGNLGAPTPLGSASSTATAFGWWVPSTSTKADGLGGVMHIQNPRTTLWTTAELRSSYIGSGSRFRWDESAQLGTVEWDGLTVFASAGTLTGKLKVVKIS